MLLNTMLLNLETNEYEATKKSGVPAYVIWLFFRRSLRINVMAMVVAVVAGCLLSRPAHAGCPIGSHPWVDSWGNSICQRFDGTTATVEGSLDDCPVGTHPWVDSWGNRVCQSFDGGSRLYDTSHGCPIGTHPWIDSWGNSIC